MRMAHGVFAEGQYRVEGVQIIVVPQSESRNEEVRYNAHIT